MHRRRKKAQEIVAPEKGNFGADLLALRAGFEQEHRNLVKPELQKHLPHVGYITRLAFPRTLFCTTNKQLLAYAMGLRPCRLYFQSPVRLALRPNRMCTQHSWPPYQALITGGCGSSRCCRVRQPFPGALGAAVGRRRVGR